MTYLHSYQCLSNAWGIFHFILQSLMSQITTVCRGTHGCWLTGYQNFSNIWNLSWKSLNHFKSFLQCFKHKTSFLSLQSLCIWEPPECYSCCWSNDINNINEQCDYVDFSSYHYPVLVELELHWVWSCPPGSLIQGLRCLNLQNLTFLQQEYCLFILHRQELKTFEISGFCSFQANQGNDNHNHKITFTLPCLLDLTFYNTSHNVIIYILNRCRAPHLQSLSISNLDKDKDPINDTLSVELTSEFQSTLLSEALLLLVSLPTAHGYSFHKLSCPHRW